MNVEQLLEALGVKEADLSPCGSEFEMQGMKYVCAYVCVYCEMCMCECECGE